MLDGPHAHHEGSRAHVLNEAALTGMRFDLQKVLAMGLTFVCPLLYAGVQGVRKSADQLLGSGAAFTASALGYLAIPWNEAIDATASHVYVTFVMPVTTLSGLFIGQQSAPLTTSELKWLVSLCSVIFGWTWLIRLVYYRLDSAAAGLVVWHVIITNCCIFCLMMTGVIGAATGFWTVIDALLIVPWIAVLWVLGALLWSTFVREVSTS